MRDLNEQDRLRVAVAWLRWRGGPRLALAITVTLSAVAMSSAYEILGVQTPRREALVFPPIQPRTPLKPVINTPPAAPALKPSSVRPATQPPVIAVPAKNPKPVTPAATTPEQPNPVRQVADSSAAVKPPMPDKVVSAQPRPAPVKPAVTLPSVSVTPAPTGSPTPAPSQTPPREYVEVITREVPINARGLSRRDFHVESDDPNVEWEVVKVDYKRNVEERVQMGRPFSVATLFDQSGSVATTDRNGDRIPAAEGMLKHLPSDTPVSVVHFQTRNSIGGGIRFEVKTDQPFTTDMDRASRAIGGLRGHEDGATPLYTALAKTINLLATQPATRDRIVICFSDGRPEGDSADMDAAKVVERARAANVRIFFVALGGGDTTLREMASGTGGEVLDVADPSRLDEAFASLARKVTSEDKSSYRCTLRAKRRGKPFSRDERIGGTIHVNGQSVPFSTAD